MLLFRPSGEAGRVGAPWTGKLEEEPFKHSHIQTLEDPNPQVVNKTNLITWQNTLTNPTLSSLPNTAVDALPIQ